MKFEPYLNFNGQCAEAFKLYERVLGGRIDGMMTHGAWPIAAEVPAGWRDRLLHARLVFGTPWMITTEQTPD